MFGEKWRQKQMSKDSTGPETGNRLQLSCWNARQAKQLREALKGIEFVEEDWRGGSYPNSPEILFFIDDLTLPQLSRILAQASKLAIASKKTESATISSLLVYAHFAVPINGATVWEGYLKPEDFGGSHADQ